MNIQSAELVPLAADPLAPQPSAAVIPLRDEVDAVYQSFAETAYALTEIENQMLAQIRRRGFEPRILGGRWSDRVKFAI